MKKIISVLICLMMIISLVPFTVSAAAGEINFTLRIQSETDNEVVLVLDYDSGTGFSALDIDIAYDRVNLELKSCEKGTGYSDFQEYLDSEKALSICSINPNENPIKVSMANTIGFKVIKGNKSVVTLTFAKAAGTDFTKESLTFDFTNCQTAAFEDIKVNFDYDMTPPKENVTNNTAEGSTEYPQQTSADNAIDDTDSEIGESDKDDVIDESPYDDPDETTGAEVDKKPATKTIIIIVAVVAVVGAGAFVALRLKSKKKKD